MQKYMSRDGQESGNTLKNDNKILDKFKLQELCEELTGNKNILEDRVINALAVMVD